jgi:hypothetical protein
MSMTRQWLGAGVVMAAVVVAMAASPEAGQSNARPASAGAAAPRASKPYVAPKTPWGDPDIQGGWTNVSENGIPMEKPNNLAAKQLEEVDDSELADLIRERNERAAANAAGIGGRETGAGPTHWYEHYDAKNSRAWMVSDPPDGRIPPLTAQAQQRTAGRGRGAGGGGGDGGRADSWLDRSLYDRCITRGFPGSMTPAIYGNAYDITQAPGVVAIRYEMIHETRVIPLDDSRRPAVNSYMGVARGHWEGDTLVVESTNYKEGSRFRNGSAKLRLVERFKPVAKDKIEWSLTVIDPDTWTKPWTYGMQLTQDPEQTLFEYACHEGNYAMRNILSAARADEAAAKTQK